MQYNAITNQKAILDRMAEKSYCVEEIKFIKMTGEEIRHYVDIDYKGEGKEILCVYYKPEMCACDNYILNWEYVRPDEIESQWNI